VSPKPTVTIRTSPEDFVVDEIAAYEPGGKGEHVYVCFRKRGLTTLDAVRLLAERMGVSPRDVGTAGLKDRHAVTTQWASFLLPIKREMPTPEALSSPDGSLVVLRVERHDNKLKTGHLRGNRFRLVLREVSADDQATLLAAFERIGREGLPNWFGEQRFGRAGDNVEVALSWMRGTTRPPRDPKIKRLQYSAVQSALFHRVLQRRVDEGTWLRAIPGDVLQKTETGGLFNSVDPLVDQPRLDAREVVTTGPMFGEKMRAAEGDALTLELTALADSGIDPALFATWSRLGEGTRRPLALFPTEMVARRPLPDEDPCSMVVEFVLPKGAYATSVLAEASTFRDASFSRDRDRGAERLPEPEQPDPAAETGPSTSHAEEENG
jgi:tRNA pseudouridine13 synthase